MLYKGILGCLMLSCSVIPAWAMENNSQHSVNTNMTSKESQDMDFVKVINLTFGDLSSLSKKNVIYSIVELNKKFKTHNPNKETMKIVQKEINFIFDKYANAILEFDVNEKMFEGIAILFGHQGISDFVKPGGFQHRYSPEYVKSLSFKILKNIDLLDDTQRLELMPHLISIFPYVVEFCDNALFDKFIGSFKVYVKNIVFGDEKEIEEINKVSGLYIELLTKIRLKGKGMSTYMQNNLLKIIQ